MRVSTVISTRLLIDPRSFSSHSPRGLDTIRFPEHKVHTAHVAPVQHGRTSGTMRRGYIHAGRYVVPLILLLPGRRQSAFRLRADNSANA